MEITKEEFGSRIFKYTFEINERVKLHTTFNEAMMRKASDYMEALKVARRIPNVDEIDAKYEGVTDLAKVIFAQQEALYRKADSGLPIWITQNIKKKSPQEILQDSVERWQAHLGMWLNALQVEAVILALVSEGLLEVDGQDIHRGFFKYQYVSGIRLYSQHDAIEAEAIDPNYFDNTALNKERLAEGIPPLFKRDPLIAQEQMLAIIDAVKRANPDFGISLSNFFNDYADKVTVNAFQMVSEVAAMEYDEGGFHSEPVDTDTPAPHGDTHKKVGRKPRTTPSAV